MRKNHGHVNYNFISGIFFSMQKAKNVIDVGNFYITENDVRFGATTMLENAISYAIHYVQNIIHSTTRPLLLSLINMKLTNSS